MRDGRGLSLYPESRLYEETGFIAYYFHWSHDVIMDMEHRERRKWCEEISKINRKMSDEPNRHNPFDVFK
ncbi:hypothetical protein BK133_17690 [Paenibacillus sp. FSL H8-0548]|uniref:DUF6760 family protein n=1 Tax=Paenibacillus sp. FSL H8-0548 TaxID=1920422 RepID=UPI00096E530B|nr:hypothetical protein BK133_17690 [Paenibacillus sp. FSL H8-0548]